ncbi:MAG: CCA tRNA nucleotidyltransferase [Nitrospirae bacterium]|nr:CCA tRNA nucleotidyltransferase [Nitrospirota bacterium]MBF0591577.1 CCA tRNA nucleotidyltransferase [Nitrospirota bacterium]
MRGDIRLNSLYRRLVDFLQGACPDAEMYVVGGTVRDILMGRALKDVDVAISADPVTVARAFAAEVRGSFVWLHERIPTARVVKGWATPGVKGDATVDFTTLRGGCLKTDLLSRDFTINALAMPLDALSDNTPNLVARIVDVTGGIDDLRGGVIRMVNRENLIDDPLRLLRAYRFSAQLGFRIEPDTLNTITELKTLIHRAAVERIWSELKAILATANSTAAIASMTDNALLFELIPELHATKAVTQNRHHNLDVLQHTMAAYEAAEAEINDLDGRGLPYPERFRQYLHCPPTTMAILKLAVLLHDIGKPATRAVADDGQVTFYDHSRVGAEMTRDILLRFKASQREVELTSKLVLNHQISSLQSLGMRLNPTFSPEITGNKRVMVRLLNKVSTEIYALIIIALADTQAKTLSYRDEIIQMAQHILRFYHEQYMPRAQAPRFITGHDLIEGFGLRPSPEFRLILEHINDKALEGTINSRQEALSAVRAYLQK